MMKTLLLARPPPKAEPKVPLKGGLGDRERTELVSADES